MLGVPTLDGIEGSKSAKGERCAFEVFVLSGFSRAQERPMANALKALVVEGFA